MFAKRGTCSIAKKVPILPQYITPFSGNKKKMEIDSHPLHNDHLESMRNDNELEEYAREKGKKQFEIEEEKKRLEEDKKKFEEDKKKFEEERKRIEEELEKKKKTPVEYDIKSIPCDKLLNKPEDLLNKELAPPPKKRRLEDIQLAPNLGKEKVYYCELIDKTIQQPPKIEEKELGKNGSTQNV
jgi:hypothetical protein